jgi:uncharacterized protein (DUF983 family)
MKSSPLYSIFTGTCPRCHEGKVFLYKNPYNLKHIMEMHQHCSKCGLNFKPETGFYFGATYVSYAIGVAICVTIAFAMAPFISFFENFWLYAGVMVGTVTVLFPVIFRISRIGWLKIFNRYDKDAIKKHQHSIENTIH